MTREDCKTIVDEIDFIKDASNVYRTKNYIVRQILSIEVIDAATVVYSRDTFFKRTKLRNAQYNFIHNIQKGFNNKRVPATMTTRIYVD